MPWNIGIFIKSCIIAINKQTHSLDVVDWSALNLQLKFYFTVILISHQFITDIFFKKRLSSSPFYTKQLFEAPKKKKKFFFCSARKHLRRCGRASAASNFNNNKKKCNSSQFTKLTSIRFLSFSLLDLFSHII
jgi:hypothetical protein